MAARREHDGPGLRGQVIAENVSGRACALRLSWTGVHTCGGLHRETASRDAPVVCIQRITRQFGMPGHLGETPALRRVDASFLRRMYVCSVGFISRDVIARNTS